MLCIQYQFNFNLNAKIKYSFHFLWIHFAKHLIYHKNPLCHTNSIQFIILIRSVFRIRYSKLISFLLSYNSLSTVENEFFSPTCVCSEPKNIICSSFIILFNDCFNPINNRVHSKIIIIYFFQLPHVTYLMLNVNVNKFDFNSNRNNCFSFFV